jgi:tRNA threonylcarbamoyladenosine biosynthesis protein TsaE
MAQTQVSMKHYCRQEADTAQLAKLLAAEIQAYMELNPSGHLNIALEGNLGAGKTSFARYLIQNLGFAGKVKSPTYTLCEPYVLNNGRVPFTAYHFDLYRMKDPLEWQEAGFAEYFDEPGFCIVEWPGQANDTLPPFDIQIELSAGEDENERSVFIQAFSNDGNNILKRMSLHVR